MTDLLSLRLGVLSSDIDKVERAVELAEQRNRVLADTRDVLQRHCRKVEYAANRLENIATAIDKDPEIGFVLDEAVGHLSEEVQRAAKEMKELCPELAECSKNLNQALNAMVRIERAQSANLQKSFHRQCERIRQQIASLQASIAGGGGAPWQRYQEILEQEAEPLFLQYVDFLGGLTLRDSGFDDRVCEMTDVLLTRFSGITDRPQLPLPSRRAAPGTALESVVLIGFPEWSIWGIPLVGYEIGLAAFRKDPDLRQLAEKAVADGGPAGLAGPQIVHLLADVFATYTLGPPYAWAALLLRLSPRAHRVAGPGRPADAERARVIMNTLRTSSAGGTFSDVAGHLESQWNAAVRGAGEASPDTRADWLGELVQMVTAELRKYNLIILPYHDDKRLERSDDWLATLSRGLTGDLAESHWGDPGTWGDSVLDLLTAAWRLWLPEEKGAPWGDAVRIGNEVTRLWLTRPDKGGVRDGKMRYRH